ncbi:acetate and sugar kinases/Hsc70/actin family protein [Noviherbaspirillum pedocola]|uniref:GDA1/CD39 family protein n=1 Tax=Noviherbaspirillum pedocola TaxID=2801341 RepID=A0A934SUM5_9BURK|nr:hypothetical protein [Noviherbaspirillum pedocola]MBK4733127.1 hypothetical protein [Noviherbaspirillum pedocola]
MNPRPLLNHAFLSLLLCLAGCAGLQSASSYLTVIDVGSSGSRAHLYRVARDHERPRVEDVAEFTIDKLPALASFGAQPAAAGPQGMQPLLARLGDYLDAHAIARDSVRVDVLATAGMRLLAEADPHAERAVYASVRETIARDGYAPGRAATISGADEGRYAWVDVNYLNRAFDTPGPTTGIIEVGGASAQVAYATNNEHHAGVETLTIGGMRHAVLSVSFLGLGQNEARRAMIAASGTTMNPCYPNNDNGAAPVAFDADIGKPAVTIASGAYNAADCAGLYRRVIAPFDIGANAKASDFETARFIGLSSIFHALSEWDGLDRPETLGQRVDESCSGENAWSMKVVPLQKETSKYAQNACANGTYIDALLFDGKTGLGLDGVKLHSVKRINGMAPTWTRGYAVLEAGG